ncbi:MAG: glycosyltransferase [Desulfobacterales bacterium]|nr:glycosyltransferase [Desulfobacterales bacterium]
MNSNNPKVSVIVPTYNRADMIGSCIEAVLSQTMQDFEIIIVSDGSTDETEKVVKNYHDARILFFEKENGGQASARNLGINKSTGRYISLCDDDDRFYQDHLMILSNFLDEHEDVGLVYSDAICRYKDPDKKPEIMYSQDFDKRSLENYNYITPVNVLFRRSCLKKSGLFNEAPVVKGLEDWDFFLKFSNHYSLCHISKVTSEYRIHEENSFHPDSGYDYNKAFFHVRTQRFQYLTAKFGPFLFDHVDHMYPYHLVQCYLNNGKIKESLEIAQKLQQIYMTYSKDNNKAPFAELVIFFSLGISNFAAGYETKANNFFRIIIDHPSYALIKDQFDEFANQYVNRIPNVSLKALLRNYFL